MSAALSQSVLSREELNALLDASERKRGALRVAGLRELTGSRAELGRVSVGFADELGRGLSTLYQTPIALRLTHWEEITLRQFGSAMLETDRVARFEIGGSGAEARVLMSRPMFFGWMLLAFGAGPNSATDVLPTRPYTRIEKSFLQRASNEIANCLSKVLAHPRASNADISLESPAALLANAKRPYLVVSFEVTGLGEASSLRIALPIALVENKGDGPSRLLPPSSDLAAEVRDMPVELRVEIGFADLTLERVASLRPGDEIPLERSSETGLIVHIEGAPKYRAEAGAVMHKLAVRITEVLNRG